MLSTAPLPSNRRQSQADNHSASSFFAPVNSFNNFLDRPSQPRRQKEGLRHHAARRARENAALEEARREAATQHAASQHAEQASRDLARDYLDRFLETSEWQDHLDRIGIIEEAVPTMEELESYGTLDEAEGTRACRRLFKAVVVWEKVGRSLWEKLRDETLKDEQIEHEAYNHSAKVAEASAGQLPDDASRPLSQRHAVGSRDPEGLAIIMEQASEAQGSRHVSLTSFASSLSHGRKSSISSFGSPDRHSSRPRPSAMSVRPQPITRRSSSVPVSFGSRRHLQRGCDCDGHFDHDCPRRATDPGVKLSNEWSPDENREQGANGANLKAAATFPRRLSKNCANAVRRTIEALHDPRGKQALHSKRRASVGY